MKRILTLMTVIMLVPFFVKAQDLSDALRFSQFQVTGTARSGSMGNAFGALGGDFTSVSINPAGLGLYRTGELVFTPAFGKSEVESNYLGNLMTDSKYNFSLNNLSYVSAIQTGSRSESGLINLNVGIGYNRLKDFNNEMIAGANDVESSFLDDLIENANNEDPNQGWRNYIEGLAYYDPETETGADLIYEEEYEGYYYWRSDLQKNPFDENKIRNYPHYQRKNTSKKGSIDEYSLALGLNFNHKLYIGASVGIIDVDYDESSTLIEEDSDNSIPRFNMLEFNSRLQVAGTGYNGKLGVIFKPINEIRLGASLHSPTFYNLHEYYDTYMYSNNTFENYGTLEDDSDFLNEYNYDIETPLRATLSGGFVIAKKGLLSVDYEYVNYGSAKLRRGGGDYNFIDENTEIEEAYKSVGNLRVGGELLATSNIAIRAGFELYPSAYNESLFGDSQPNSDTNLKVYSAGLGYRSGGFFFDIAYRYSEKNYYNLLYKSPYNDYYPQPEFAKFTNVKNNVMFTLGFKF